MNTEPNEMVEAMCGRICKPFQVNGEANAVRNTAQLPNG